MKDRTPRPQFKGCPFGCLDWETCPHTGHARAPAKEEDSPVPPETYRRRDKELSNSPKNILQRKYSRQRREAAKRIREET